VLGGRGLEGVVSVQIGGVDATVVRAEPTRVVVVTGHVAPGVGLGVVARRDDGERAVLDGAVESWSPAELPGARVWDAAHGVAGDVPGTRYEWQHVGELPATWRVRDGNTATWLPATGRFWMVGGWNGLQEPDGFSPIPPGTWPPLNTTDEVWSSPDGVTWTLELPHGNGAFERRHVHNTVVWQDELWVVGGDTHQGYYNHDVLRSADGLDWTVVLGPGTTEPPWPERALQISGVFDGRLWTGGGQDLLGDPAAYTYHNDLWVTDDGEAWTQVAADGPASDTRWGGCGLVDGFVEHAGRMWLVGCARYRDDAVGTSMVNEVWSTADGVEWTRHPDPPWAGKAWANAFTWDGHLWVAFGYTYGDPEHGWPAGNANELWWTDDGETWTSLPPDAPVPGSHAQGVAVTDEAVWLLGGNHSFGLGLGPERAIWRLVAARGAGVTSWTERGAEGLVARPPHALAQPLLVPDAFGPGRPGLHFDGSRTQLALDAPDVQPDGRSVFFVGRLPELPPPYPGWDDTYAPVGTVVGGPDETNLPTSSIGLGGGRLQLRNRQPELGVYGEPTWSGAEAGAGLQVGAGEVHLVGLTHGADGALAAWVDGAPVTVSGTASYAGGRGYSRLGGSFDGDDLGGGAYYGPNQRFAGTLGAVVVVPAVLGEDDVARLTDWARGRFGSAASR
jgi:hypothetical protein